MSICHEEVPVAPKGSQYSGYPEFAVPAEIARGSLLLDSTPAVPPRTTPSTVACQV
ncbi:enzyme of poly-gamma-glutamate biosynthesis [Cutibacterium acnes JCM 18916]|nr:enzyme of poly-gamma-glutamate biosynthesis [Cutibacterium acnes JCM 18916]